MPTLFHARRAGLFLALPVLLGACVAPDQPVMILPAAAPLPGEKPGLPMALTAPMALSDLQSTTSSNATSTTVTEGNRTTTTTTGKSQTHASGVTVGLPALLTPALMLQSPNYEGAWAVEADGNSCPLTLGKRGADGYGPAKLGFGCMGALFMTDSWRPAKNGVELSDMANRPVATLTWVAPGRLEGRAEGKTIVMWR